MGKSLSTDALAALNNCTVIDEVVKLGPIQLERKIYTEVKDALEGIGGKWKGGKVLGFVFTHDPSDLLIELKGGNKINLKKDFQFFGTPASLCDKLVEMSDIQPGLRVLEPEAGQGAIIEAIRRKTIFLTIDYYELMLQNADIIKQKFNMIETVQFVGNDFLEAPTTYTYDRIIANPPFSKNQDIDHIYKMYELLRENGIITTIASKHWQSSSNKKELQFRNWLKEVNATIEDVDGGEFKESGTMVATCIIRIKK